MFKLPKEIKSNPIFNYLFLLVFAAMSGFQAWRTLFNNFGVEVAGINGMQVGVIQAVREIPGFISLFVVFVIIIIKEYRLSAISIIVFGLGVTITGLFPSYAGLVFTTFLMSLGFHYFEATNQSLTLQYFKKEETPVVLGFFKSMGAMGNIIIGVIIWTLTKFVKLENIFLIVGIPVVLIALYALTKKIPDSDKAVQRKKIFLKKEYWLYYVLSFYSYKIY